MPRETASAIDREETLAGTCTEDALKALLGSNRTIGIAIGITMSQLGVGRDAAHAYLVRLSQNSNLKLRDVARIIVGDADASSRRGV